MDNLSVFHDSNLQVGPRHGKGGSNPVRPQQNSELGTTVKSSKLPKGNNNSILKLV